MRLSCPNCDAQYEVDARAIPVDGRDVQCSNCGHTWFQHHPDTPPGSLHDDGANADDPETVVAAHDTGAPDAGAVEDDTAKDDAKPADADPAGPADPGHGQGNSDVVAEAGQPSAHTADDEAAGTGEAPWPSSGPASEDPHRPAADVHAETPTADTWPDTEHMLQAEANDDTPDLDPGAVPRRRELDPEVAALLREEAEREARARRAEAEGFESQPDLGLRPEPRRVVPSPAPTPATATRRGDLPDIEEVNSNLRAQGDEAPMPPPPQAGLTEDPPPRGGFRAGFVSTIFVGLVALAAYGFAPTISARVPALAPVMDRYVDAVDTARIWLDDRIRSALNPE